MSRMGRWWGVAAGVLALTGLLIYLLRSGNESAPAPVWSESEPPVAAGEPTPLSVSVPETLPELPEAVIAPREEPPPPVEPEPPETSRIVGRILMHGRPLADARSASG